MAEPQVRFKKDDGSSYPAWNDVVLGDIATRVTRKNTNGETNRPLTIASIEGLVDQRTYFGKTIASKDMSGYYLLKNGEYAYNKSYSAGYDYGSIKRLDKYDMGALSTLYICFALNKDQNTDFYDCYFNGLSWYNQMPQICAEGARNHGLLNVSPNDFFKIWLSVPSSKEEQQKIADFLSSVDDVISTSAQEVANLETQKKAVMKKVFSQEVRFKKADGSGFPEWEETTIGAIGDVITGSTPSTKDAGNYGHDFCFCAPGDLGNGKYVVNTEKKVSEKGFKSGRAVPGGSVLATCIGSTIGKMGMAGCDMITNQQINSIIVKEDDSEYVYYAIGYCFPQYLSSVGKQAVPILSKSEFSKKLFPLPCLEEQHLIADFLSDFDEAIAAAKKELELWKELKKGLLQQVFV